MKTIDKLISKMIADIMYPEGYGWPPSCVGIFFQPERPETQKLEIDSKPDS